jgi:hypothetical protein
MIRNSNNRLIEARAMRVCDTRAFKKALVGIAVVCFMLIPTAAIGAFGQTGRVEARIDFAKLDRLADNAEQTVDVALDEKMIQLASKFLSSARSSNEAKLKEIVSKLKGIYVRSFQFDQDGQYSDADIIPVLSQLSGSSWSRIVDVSSKKSGEVVKVYVMKSGDSVEGLAILAVEPREVTVVNIVGPIDIEKISELEGSFGIPKLGLDPTNPQTNLPKK